MNGNVDLAVERIGLEWNALAGKVAVVTGAGRGIGREIARALAWLGAQVIIAEISGEGLETERLIQGAGGKAWFVPTDVSKLPDVLSLKEKIRTRFGPVEILINNAILCPVVSVLDMEVDLWDCVMAVNLRGTFLTCKFFLEDMLERQDGTILNMISTDAMPNLSAYIASKQGIAAFSQSLAGEVGQQGIRVIAFAPGFVDTPGLRSAARGLAANFGMTESQFMQMSIHPAYQERAMPADHAAAAAAYLLVELADEYHGEQVNGYTVLERAGFIQPLGGAQVAENISFRTAALTHPGTSADILRKAFELSTRLEDVLRETSAEFNKLPIFVRPMARAGFKNKSGKSIQDWIFAVETLSGQLKEVGLSLDAGAIRELIPNASKLIDYLGKLSVYYQDVPAETARFTRDAKLLEAVTQISRERVKLVGSLQELIGSL